MNTLNTDVAVLEEASKIARDTGFETQSRHKGEVIQLYRHHRAEGNLTVSCGDVIAEFDKDSRFPLSNTEWRSKLKKSLAARGRRLDEAHAKREAEALTASTRQHAEEAGLETIGAIPGDAEVFLHTDGTWHVKLDAMRLTLEQAAAIVQALRLVSEHTEVQSKMFVCSQDCNGLAPIAAQLKAHPQWSQSPRLWTYDKNALLAFEAVMASDNERRRMEERHLCRWSLPTDEFIALDEARILRDARIALEGTK